MKKIFLALSLLSSMVALAVVNVEVTARLNQDTVSTSGKLPAQESLCIDLKGIKIAVNLLSESESAAKFDLIILQAFRDQEFGNNEAWRPISQQEVTVTLGQSAKINCPAEGIDADVTIQVTKATAIDVQ